MGTIKKKGKQTTKNIIGSNDERQGTKEHKAIDTLGDDCRCKEVSEKTFPEMFRLMINDLSFWKKTKGQK